MADAWFVPDDEVGPVPDPAEQERLEADVQELRRRLADKGATVTEPETAAVERVSAERVAEVLAAHRSIWVNERNGWACDGCEFFYDGNTSGSDDAHERHQAEQIVALGVDTTPPEPTPEERLAAHYDAWRDGQFSSGETLPDFLIKKGWRLDETARPEGDDYLLNTEDHVGEE